MDRLSQKIFNNMAKALGEKVYSEVGKRIVDESKENARKNGELIKAHIEDFDTRLRERVREIIKEEYKGN